MRRSEVTRLSAAESPSRWEQLIEELQRGANLARNCVHSPQHRREDERQRHANEHEISQSKARAALCFLGKVTWILSSPGHAVHSTASSARCKSPRAPPPPRKPSTVTDPLSSATDLAIEARKIQATGRTGTGRTRRQKASRNNEYAKPARSTVRFV